MKINGIQRVGGANPYSRQEAKLTDLKGKRGPAKDEVQISMYAQELLEAQSKANNELRTQKIQELKQSVASGTYYVDAGKIAEKLYPYLK